MSLQTIKSANEPLKILALHGRGSNGDVTRMQLENLGLLDSEYEIIHINGPISTQEPGSGLSEMERIVSGPWFSWLPRYENEEKVDSALLLRAICEAVKLVLDTVTEHGPFDGVFGFSQGGVVASLVNGLPHDNALKEALIDIYGAEINENYLKQKAFTTTIVACAAAPLSIHSLRMVAGLGDMPTPEFSSLHLIGKNDQFKPWSESLALSFGANNAEVYYLNDGHEISRNLRHDAQLGNILRASFSHDSSHQVASIENVSKANWQQSSPISARKVDLKTQIAEVQISNSEDSETISDLLAAQPAGAPLFRVAREKNENVLTTYGQLLAFFQPEGEGDLRRIGVEPGDVVAYLAPSGGNATAAAAFLSIASQTCAVPFSPNMSAADALMALEQFNVKHVIVFENVVAKGVMQAIEAYAAEHTLNVRNATAYSAHTPGLFKFEETIEDFEQLPALKTAPTDNGLLLRTSGTTSVPKVVPLRLKDLVTNGVILADGMGLNANDVTYSVMPLDHIGGLSASILCSIAVGASITCDGLYNPQDMVDALKSSNPQPTWYSAVPTIHNATVRFLQDNADAYLSDNGEWFGHNLRMIRSGAAALKESDRESLAQTFGCEVVTTYSMSELMPICQPPRKEIGWQQQAGAVGVPVSASMAIVDPVSLKPMPFGGEGEIAISGETVFTGYLDNAEANNKSRFIMKSPSDGQLKTWFLTGDLGEMDKDGTVFLRGRIKELIKRGGEQIAPAEVENVLTLHPSIKAAVCFSVASETYGEEVGCALVLEPSSSQTITANNALKELRALLRENGLAPHKYPSVWRIVEKEQLPMTASKKYKRNGLAKVLGITSAESEKQQVKESRSANSVEKSARKEKTSSKPSQPLPEPSYTVTDKPKVDWEALAGFRFILACYVMFMHIGSNESWDAFSNLRQFPWHVHAFFALAGYSLAIIMPSFINKKAAFVKARVWGMYPLYALAVVLAVVNLIPSCNPSAFSAVFNWSPLLSEGGQVCQGTPLVENSWLANFLLTIGIHLTGLQATPLWGASWFLGFYLWFISMYFQCLIVFPMIYNALYKNRGKTKRLLALTVLGLVVNLVIVLGFWYGYAVDAVGYGLYDAITGVKTVPTPEQVEMAGKDNAVILGFYLFAPFWMVYFVAGMCAAFLYDAIRPSEQQKAKIWGYVADTITVIMVLVSLGHVAQGYFPYGSDVTSVAVDAFFMRPEEANSYADPSTVNRIWDNIWGRLFAPITLLWIFAISTGKGLTAKALRFSPLSQTLAPTAYACFLFHQMVGQWYYAATRHGDWWNWWTHQKTFYWFSPQPVPVEWYEYFYVVGLVVLFAKLVQPMEPAIRRSLAFCGNKLTSLRKGAEEPIEERDTITEILAIVERSTGMEVQPEWNLEECGLASLGVVQFTSSLETEFSTTAYKLELSVTDILEANDLNEIASIVDSAISEIQSETSTAEVGIHQLA